MCLSAEKFITLFIFAHKPEKFVSWAVHDPLQQPSLEPSREGGRSSQGRQWGWRRRGRSLDCGPGAICKRAERQWQVCVAACWAYNPRGAWHSSRLKHPGFQHCKTFKSLLLRQNGFMYLYQGLHRAVAFPGRVGHSLQYREAISSESKRDQPIFGQGRWPSARVLLYTLPHIGIRKREPPVSLLLPERHQQLQQFFDGIIRWSCIYAGRLVYVLLSNISTQVL